MVRYSLDISFLIDALEAYDNGTRYVDGDFATAGIWATYPQSFMSAGGCYADQVYYVKHSSI